MKITRPPHSFHIPVMGLGFTIDTPLKVAHLGISSVVSIIEDELIERMREHHCGLNHEPFRPIHKPGPDHRAKRITAYLDLLQRLVDRNMERMRATPITRGSASARYFELLPESSALRKEYFALLALPAGKDRDRREARLHEAMVPGAIDVNIMAKIDPVNYDREGNPLPPEYCDAMAAFRGFANSTLSSSLVLSAGYNPRLYAYIPEFPDFLPDLRGQLRKKIILKVSDLRSAQVQGRLLAKKGVWVSEFRIESGLNCGGHAFATDGLLMGPILESFRQERHALHDELWHTCNAALSSAGKPVFVERPAQRVTTQGGIGTAAEDRFLREHYRVDGTGWGSPFLFVPEATNVDPATLDQLVAAKPSDFFLSHASPLGVPFHNFRPSTSEHQRKARIAKDRPGSACYKEYLRNNTEFSKEPICTSSRLYQHLKIKQLKTLGLDEQTLQREIDAVTEKDCLCEGLGASALLNVGLTPAHKLEAVAICPGPNAAYYNKRVTLQTMVDHIYGRANLLAATDRPHMFIKELSLYVDHFRDELKRAVAETNAKQQRRLAAFRTNLLDGVQHYRDLLPALQERLAADVQRMRTDLDRYATEIKAMVMPGQPAIA
ncbi:MAG: hypothetical protein JST98_02395 [Bacteroidetes bacterium]|nr:hypothetical protein [Bacteroidota bacterium]